MLQMFIKEQKEKKKETKKIRKRGEKTIHEAAPETRNSRLFSSLNSETHLLLNQFILDMPLTLLTICSDPNHEQKKGRQ